MKNYDARLRYSICKLNNCIRELGGEYIENKDWVNLQKKYFLKSLELLDGTNAISLYKSFQLFEQKERRMYGSDLAKIFIIAIFMFTIGLPLLKTKIAWDIFNNLNG